MMETKEGQEGRKKDKKEVWKETRKGRKEQEDKKDGARKERKKGSEREGTLAQLQRRTFVRVLASLTRSLWSNGSRYKLSRHTMLCIMGWQIIS